MEKFKQNERYLENNYNEIEKSYCDKFIAVDNGQIIATNERIEKSIEELDRNNKNAPTVIIKLISKNLTRSAI
ncbi:MAG: hypothetical protein ACTHJ2_00680 [Candidatus Nitrosocosmicus sp.]